MYYYYVGITMVSILLALFLLSSFLLFFPQLIIPINMITISRTFLKPASEGTCLLHAFALSTHRICFSSAVNLVLKYLAFLPAHVIFQDEKHILIESQN